MDLVRMTLRKPAFRPGGKRYKVGDVEPYWSMPNHSNVQTHRTSWCLHRIHCLVATKQEEIICTDTERLKMQCDYVMSSYREPQITYYHGGIQWHRVRSLKCMQCGGNARSLTIHRALPQHAYMLWTIIHVFIIKVAILQCHYGIHGLVLRNWLSMSFKLW